jgi:hypothetical protein
MPDFGLNTLFAPKEPNDEAWSDHRVRKRVGTDIG